MTTPLWLGTGTQGDKSLSPSCLGTLMCVHKLILKVILIPCSLDRLVNLNIGALFSPPIVEEEFRDLIGNCMFKLLENPSVAHQKCNGLRTSVLQVLGTMNAKFNYALSFRLKIVQGLKHFEHLVVRQQSRSSNGIL